MKRVQNLYLGQIIQGREEAIKRQEKWTKKGYVAGGEGGRGFSAGEYEGRRDKEGSNGE